MALTLAFALTLLLSAATAATMAEVTAVCHLVVDNQHGSGVVASVFLPLAQREHWLEISRFITLQRDYLAMTITPTHLHFLISSRSVRNAIMQCVAACSSCANRPQLFCDEATLLLSTTCSWRHTFRKLSRQRSSHQPLCRRAV